MLLFLSTSFLRRLNLVWKPDLKAFLIGERNLNFFTPDSIFEVSEISEKTIQTFIENSNLAARWELLGFLTRDSNFSLPGFVEIRTAGSIHPKDWQAHIPIPGEKSNVQKSVAIKLPS